MKDALKIYFGRTEIKFYIFLLLINLTYIAVNGSLNKYWYIFILIILLSPFNEYFIHKYFLHFPMQKNKLINKFLQNIHYQHHLDTKNVDFIFAQLWLTFPALILDILIAYFISFSINIALVVGVSIIFYYLIYEWFHFVAHSAYTPKNAYMKYMKKYHILHHFKNEKYWFGVTNPIADFIFGKYKNPDSVEKSATVKTIS